MFPTPCLYCCSHEIKRALYGMWPFYSVALLQKVSIESQACE